MDTYSKELNWHSCKDSHPSTRVEVLVIDIDHTPFIGFYRDKEWWFIAIEDACAFSHGTCDSVHIVPWLWAYIKVPE